MAYSRPPPDPNLLILDPIREIDKIDRHNGRNDTLPM